MNVFLQVHQIKAHKKIGILWRVSSCSNFNVNIHKYLPNIFMKNKLYTSLVNKNLFVHLQTLRKELRNL